MYASAQAVACYWIVGDIGWDCLPSDHTSLRLSISRQVGTLGFPSTIGPSGSWVIGTFKLGGQVWDNWQLCHWALDLLSQVFALVAPLLDSVCASIGLLCVAHLT